MAKKRIYWDACMWIGLINGEAGTAERCQFQIEMARKGEVEIWTSSLTLAEVFKKKCEGDQKELDAAKDVEFTKYIEQDFLTEVQLDHDVGILARKLLRDHSQIKKPTDAIHLASALLNNVDELHTKDGENLIPLDGKLMRVDGKTLRICEPPEPTNQQMPIALEGGGPNDPEPSAA